MASHFWFFPRETIILVTLMVVSSVTLYSIQNPHRVLTLFPAGRKLEQMDILLDLNEALCCYKTSGLTLAILAPKTPLATVLSKIRPYIQLKSRLLVLDGKHYLDSVKSLKAQGIGTEYIFIRYKSASYPDPTVH